MFNFLKKLFQRQPDMVIDGFPATKTQVEILRCLKDTYLVGHVKSMSLHEMLPQSIWYVRMLEDLETLSRAGLITCEARIVSEKGIELTVNFWRLTEKTYQFLRNQDTSTEKSL